MYRRIGVLAVLLALSGCLPPQTGQLRQVHAPILQQNLRLSVPAYVDSGHLCGPTALAMVLTCMGVSKQPADLTEALYLPEKQGTLQVEMAAAARLQGMLVIQLDGRLPELWTALHHGRVPLLLVNLAYSWWPRWHYVVVTGFSANEQSWWVNAGQDHPVRWPLPLLERLWIRAGGWGIVLVDPLRLNTQGGDLQVSVLLNAALDLERVRPDRAALAYAALAQREVHDPRLLLLEGNAWREAKDWGRAEQAYRASIGFFPKDWRGFNNLADLWHLEGRSCQPEVQQWLVQAQILAPAAERAPVLRTAREVQRACGGYGHGGGD